MRDLWMPNKPGGWRGRFFVPSLTACFCLSHSSKELLQCLGEKGGSGEAIAELASKAAQQGRPGQAEALCAAAYERYRERGNSALEAYRLTPPELRNLIGGGSEVAGGGVLRTVHRRGGGQRRPPTICFTAAVDCLMLGRSLLPHRSAPLFPPLFSCCGTELPPFMTSHALARRNVHPLRRFAPP